MKLKDYRAKKIEDCGISKDRRMFEMIYPITQSQMAVGDRDNDDHVVVVLANDGVDMVCGPFDLRRAEQKASKLIMDNFNAIAHKVEIRPLVDV